MMMSDEMWVEEAGGMAGPANPGGEFTAGGRVGSEVMVALQQVVIRSERAVRGWQGAGSLACGGRVCPS